MLSRVAKRTGYFFPRQYSTKWVVDNPYTGTIYTEVKLSNSTEAKAIVGEASTAQKEWARTSLETRIEAVEKFVQKFGNLRDEVAKDITSSMGKPLKQADGEVSGMFQRIKALIKMAPSVLADENFPEKNGIKKKITKEPVGVVLVIGPWNYPLLTVANSLIPAVLAGNAVIIKHSPRTPLVAEFFSKAFSEAGIPSGLVSYLHAPNEVVAEVISQEPIGFVSFTGSVAGGRQVYKTVAESRFIDITLELGGKDPAYVASDANVEGAAEGIIDGAFYNAGQSCCGIERVYVHSSHYDQFVDKALAIVKAYSLGDPMSAETTLGPMALPTAPAFLQHQVSEALSKGASLLTGGQPIHDSFGNGRFFAPSLLVNCNHEMSLITEESFGPVLGVISVSSDEEAVEMMNNSRYGLTAAIYTTSTERANHLAPLLQCGTVFMNRCDYLDPELPWTGVKDTGKGISLSSHGFRGVTRLKGHNFRV
eukprot:TRINITY_DN4327_c0_g1_i3.p1 TRINITY_DN4327_c0_g1~~TRINITY_DN4327_c0_g1_i3.p1  ORF type:complete len:479 (+),score=74.83 TRINITY_DN4327_c0_g1_i3:102-1538(+)